MQQAAEQVQQALREFSESHHRPYELSLSVGAACHDLRSGTVDAFLNEMDNNMYKMKEQTHRKANYKR